MTKWNCIICGYIHEGGEPPGTCPVCGVSSAEFEKNGEDNSGSATPGKKKEGKKRGNSPKKVIVYSLLVCTYCNKVLNFLDRNKIEYEHIVVDELKKEKRESTLSGVYRLTNQRAFPVTVINGVGVVGFDKEKLMSLLNISSDRKDRKEKQKPGIVDEIEFPPDIHKYYGALKKQADETGYLLNPDRRHLKKVLGNLLKNGEKYGYRSCPCRYSAGDIEKDKEIICPCIYRDSDMEKYGQCACGLYVTSDYAGDWNRKHFKRGVCRVLEDYDMTANLVDAHIKVFSYKLSGKDWEAIKKEFYSIIHL